MVVEYRSGKKVGAFLFLVLTLYLSQIVFTEIWGKSSGLEMVFGNFSTGTAVLVPISMVLWWYIWFRHWSRNTGSPWQIGAIPAFLLSALFSFQYNYELSLLAIVLLGVITFVEFQRLGKRPLIKAPVPSLKLVYEDRAARPPVEEDYQTKNINELGYKQYPGAVDVNITVDSSQLGKSVRIDFRSSATAVELLDFYEESSRACGMKPRRGQRLAESPDRPPVPALVATSGEPVALVVSRDTFDEFKWHITVWTRTWQGFRRNLDVYFIFRDEDKAPDEEISDLSRFKKPAPDVTPKKKPAEYEVFQQWTDVGSHPKPTIPPPPEIPPMTEPVTPQVEIPVRPPRPPRKPFDWGEFVETYMPVWGMFVGVTIIVLAAGYFLTGLYDLVGKVITAYAFFGAFFVMGTQYEKKPLFTTFGKTLIAGGWGGYYITTFLIYYLPEARVIHDANVATLLLIMISCGMIIHSFKYKSEMLSTLTYVIAFISVAMSAQMGDHMAYSLIASSILAVSMVIILFRMQWFRLAIFAMAGSYITHAIWLYPLTDSFEWTGIIGVNFTLGALMLIFYWIVFSLAVYFYQPKNKTEEAFNLWMNALNYSMFYLVFQYQLGPDNPMRIWLVEFLALAYVGLIFLSHRLKRENLYYHNLVLAVLSTTMALYYQMLGGNWVTIGWLFQAEALYFVGLLGDDKRYRNVGLGVFVLIGVWMVSHDYMLDDHVVLFNKFDLMKRSVIAVTVAGFFYLNAALRHWMAFRIKNEEGYSYLFSYAASVLWLIVMVRNWFPDHLLHAAFSSAIIAFILMELGIRLKDAHFRVQGIFFAFISVIAALYPMLNADALYFSESPVYRIISEAIVIILAYIVFARYKRKVSEFDDDTRGIESAIGMFSGIAAILAVVLLHREFSVNAPLWLVLGWMVLGILLVEIGLMTRNVFFRAQGYVIAGLSMVWALYSMLLTPHWFLPGPSNFIAQILVVIGFFYLFGRLLSASRSETSLFSDQERADTADGSGPWLSIAFSIAGSLILILTIQRELGNSQPLFVSVFWMIAAIVLLEAGIATMSKALRWQAWTIAGFAFLYALFNNLVPGVYLGPFSARLVSLTLMVIGLYYIFTRISAGEHAEKRWLDWAEGVNIFSWLAGILLVLVINKEVGHYAPAWVATAWLVPMVAFLIAGLRRSSRNFIVQAIVLSTLIFFWTLTMPVAGMFAPQHSQIFDAHRIFVTIPPIVIFYLVFAYFMRTGVEFGGEKLRPYLAHLADVFAWWGSALLVSLITREVGGPHAGVTTVAWVTLALIYHWVGKKIQNSTLELQGYTLITGAFLRIVFVNLDSPLVPGSLPSALITAASLYYMWISVSRSGRDNPTVFPTLQVASFFSYLATIILMKITYQLIDNVEWVPPVWGALMLLTLFTAIWLKDSRFAFKAVVMSGVVGLSVVWLTFFKYEGPAWIPAAIALVCIYIARVAWQFGIERILGGDTPEYRGVEYLRNSVPNFLSIPPSILLAALLYLKFKGADTMFMTLGFALEAFLLTIMGFALKDRLLRLTGLYILAFSVLKLIREMFVVDPGPVAKSVTLVGVGVVLLIVGWLYSSRLELKRKMRADAQLDEPEDYDDTPTY